MFPLVKHAKSILKFRALPIFPLIVPAIGGSFLTNNIVYNVW